VTVLDLSGNGTFPERSGYHGAFSHGKFLVLSPHANGAVADNYRSRPFSSLAAVIDLNDFTLTGVSIVDLAAAKR
jgi:hypothetical protein